MDKPQIYFIVSIQNLFSRVNTYCFSKGTGPKSSNEIKLRKYSTGALHKSICTITSSALPSPRSLLKVYTLHVLVELSLVFVAPSSLWKFLCPHSLTLESCLVQKHNTLIHAISYPWTAWSRTQCICHLGNVSPTS